MPGLEMRMGQQLRQEVVMRMVIDPGDLREPFRTEGEEVQVSQYAILTDLRRLIEQGEYFDPHHFSLEINRAIFGHPLEARLGTFGRDISQLAHFYAADETFVQRLLSTLGLQQEEAERKDIPGKIAGAWNRMRQSAYFKAEPREQAILDLIETVHQHDGDIAAGIDLISRSAEVRQRALVDASLKKVREYATADARMIPFAQHLAAPILRSLAARKETLDATQAELLYSAIIESVYSLDREMRIAGMPEKIAAAIEQQGLAEIVHSSLPVPLHVSLESLSPNRDTCSKFTQLCSDANFAQGRELRRKIYGGLAAVEDLTQGKDVLTHIAANAADSKGLASIFATLALVSREPDFVYPFTVQGETEIVRNLKLQLVDKSIKRLGFDTPTLERYLEKIQHDDHFARIGTILTSLAGLSYYQNSLQLGLLREIAVVEMEGRFGAYRYSHDQAAAQLAVLGENTTAWKKNMRVRRIVGELEALQSHIESVKKVLPKIIETYEAYYKESFIPDTNLLEAQIAQNETALRSEEAVNRKELGFQTHLRREQLEYVQLIRGLSELGVENYGITLEKATKIIQKRSKNPLQENARWIRETLDQPVYRDARRITIYETDDLETLLRFGEVPVAHCQNWRVNNTYNQSLLSFVADANKKLYHLANGGDKPIAMSMVRLVPWDDIPTILIENVYDQEWSADYGVALLGSVAEKAAAMQEETGGEIRLATNDERLETALEKFSAKYSVEIHRGTLSLEPAPSKNTHEYWDCGPGLVESGTKVSIDVQYVVFGKED